MAGVFLVLFAFAEILYHFLKFKAEITRKIVHFMTGILTLFFPIFIEDHWMVFALCFSFLIILVLSLRFKLLPSINAVDRKTSGSLLYPLIVFVCYLIYEHYNHLIFYYLPILILAICDPVAALIGKRFPWKKYIFLGHTKTMSGSGAFFLSSFVLSISLLIVIEKISFQDSLMMSAIIGLISTFAEAISHRGFDNLTIPASVVLLLMLFENIGWITLVNLK